MAAIFDEDSGYYFEYRQTGFYCDVLTEGLCCEREFADVFLVQ